MNRAVGRWFAVVLQAVLGIILGAIFWTAGLLAASGIGNWLVNALVLTPLLAAVVAGVIHVKARRFTIFGWSFFVGATAYGYLVSLTLLVNLRPIS